MASRKGFLVLGVALTGLTGVANGQGLGGLGSLGGVGGAPGAMTALPAAALPAAQPTLGGFFGLSKSNLAACKQKLCGSQLGQMMNSGLTPLSAMTGGLIPTCCPTVPTADQAAALAAAGGPTGAQAVAAKIKQDEADAKARRAAIRYLSTVDCHYWPEAEAAIIGGLRDDRNECVRYEAALALLNGCCCTTKTIEALKIVVSGSEKDGKPSETSERVKGVSMAALQGCLIRFHPPVTPIPLERPEPASATRPTPTLSPGLSRIAYYYVTLRDVPPALIVADAARALERVKGEAATAPPATLLTGSRSVYDALARAASTPPPREPASAKTAGARAVTGVPPQFEAAAPPPPLRLITVDPPLAPTPTPTSEPTSIPRPAPVVPTTLRQDKGAMPGALKAAASSPSALAIAANVPDHGRSREKPGAVTTQAATARPAAGRRNLRDVFLKSVGHSSAQ